MDWGPKSSRKKAERYWYRSTLSNRSRSVSKHGAPQGPNREKHQQSLPVWLYSTAEWHSVECSKKEKLWGKNIPAIYQWKRKKSGCGYGNRYHRCCNGKEVLRFRETDRIHCCDGWQRSDHPYRVCNDKKWAYFHRAMGLGFQYG